MKTEQEILDLMLEVADFIPHQEECNRFYSEEIAKLHRYHKDLQSTVVGLSLLTMVLFTIVMILIFTK